MIDKFDKRCTLHFLSSSYLYIKRNIKYYIMSCFEILGTSKKTECPADNKFHMCLKLDRRKTKREEDLHPSSLMFFLHVVRQEEPLPLYSYWEGGG